MTQVVALIALLVFALFMVIIGVLNARHAKTMDGFLLGGRKIGPWMSAFAYGTTYFSAVIFIGYAGKFGWDVGLASVWIGVGNALVGCFIAWKFLAGRVRNMTHTLNARTMPEFFQQRYNSKNMKLFSAVIIFLFLVPYAASVYKGLGSYFGKMFPDAGNLIPGLSSTVLCMLIVAVLTGLYLVFGGYMAIAMSDFVQGLIMIGGVAVLAVAITLSAPVGGLGSAISQLKAIQPSLVSFTGGGLWNVLLINILLTSVGTFGLPQMVHKFYAIKDKHAVRRATVVSTLFALVIGGGAYYVGSMGRIVLNNTLPVGGYDEVMPVMLLQTFGSTLLGSILLSVILLLLLSASMSTLSSVVLTSATAVSVDLVQQVRPKLKDKTQLKLTRVLCLLFVALSFVFATFNFAIIVSIMSYSWGIVAGSFIGPFLWGMFSKKTTHAGAWCGMLAGFATVLTMTIVSTATHMPEASGLYEAFKMASTNSPLYGVCAMGVSLAVVPLVSLVTKKFSKDHVAKCFKEADDFVAKKA